MSTPCVFFSEGIQAQPEAGSVGAEQEEKSRGCSVPRRSLQAPGCLLGGQKGAGSGAGAVPWGDSLVALWSGQARHGTAFTATPSLVLPSPR